MGFCCVVGCSNRSSRNKNKKGVRFHSFPKDQTLKNLWIQAIRRDNWEPNHHSCVCSEHFSNDVVERKYLSGLRLREDAVPSIFPAYPKHLKKVQKSKQAPPTHMSAASCFVPNCNAKGAHKFSVPKSADLRRQWESIIGRTDGRKLTEKDIVCELHFVKSEIRVVYEKQKNDTFRGVKKLADKAIPSIFPIPPATTNESAPTMKASHSLPSTSSAPTTKASASTSRQVANTTTKKKRPIKRKCCVPNCPSFESPSITLHQFPIQKERRKTWLNLLNLSDFKPTKLTRVCSKHFTSSSFSNPGELRPDAIPKLYSSSKKSKQESDPDILLSEAQKTAAWLQSVKQKREERKQKRLLEGVAPVQRKTIKAPPNPWRLSDCEVVISENERKLADEVLSLYSKKQLYNLSKCQGVPMPIVEIKEEPQDVMDLTVDDLSQLENAPLPPSPVKPILLNNKNPPQLVIPPVITANNLMFQTTLRSAAEVESTKNQPLPPSTIYRVIIPTSIQGHTIEPSSILEQLKNKISAMHQEKITKQAPPFSTPPTNTIPFTPVSMKTASSTLETSSATPKMQKKTAAVKSSHLFINKDATPSVDDHAYAAKQSSWPVLLHSLLDTPVTNVPTSAPVASTSSSLPPTTQTPGTPFNLEISSYGSVTSSQPHIAVKSVDKTAKALNPNVPKLAPLSNNVPGLPSLAYLPQGSTMKIVPMAGKTGEQPTQFLTFRSLSVGTQTALAIDTITPARQVREIKKSNETYRSKIKTLKQSLRRLQSRLLKATQELDELKSFKTLIAEQDKGKENIIVLETTEKCGCFRKRREHEDSGNILNTALQQSIPPPLESKAQLAEKEKLIKRIGFIKKKLKNKDILRVVVFQTEDLLSLC